MINATCTSIEICHSFNLFRKLEKKYFETLFVKIQSFSEFQGTERVTQRPNVALDLELPAEIVRLGKEKQFIIVQITVA